MWNFIDKLAFVYLSRRICDLCLTVCTTSFFKNAFEDITVGEEELACAVWQIVVPLSLVHGAIWISANTVALANIVTELTLIRFPVSGFQLTNAMPFII